MDLIINDVMNTGDYRSWSLKRKDLQLRDHLQTFCDQWQKDVAEHFHQDVPQAVNDQISSWISDYVADLLAKEEGRELSPTVPEDPDWDALFASEASAGTTDDASASYVPTTNGTDAAAKDASTTEPEQDASCKGKIESIPPDVGA